LQFQVPPDQAGVRLDQFLTSVLPRYSRSSVQRLIREGHVQLAGRAARANASVRAGETIALDLPAPVPSAPAPQDLPLTVVYQDSDLIVVDKPAGMVVHPAAGHSDGTLVNALLHHVRDLSGIGGEQRPGIVHRLDRGTSGLMVVAKHDAAHHALARQFQDREVEKEYVALVWGLVQAGRRIDAAIGRDPRHRKRMSAVAAAADARRPDSNRDDAGADTARSRRARTAVTRVTRAEHLDGVTLLHVAIATGRTHQIRVHLSAIGHPIVADPLYGGVRRHVHGHLRAVLRLDRPFLHAARLAFEHPADGRRLAFESPLPEDLQEVLDHIRTMPR
jgi:23S rRNA pseudouridine1911/1915/1917 synthase